MDSPESIHKVKEGEYELWPPSASFLAFVSQATTLSGQRPKCPCAVCACFCVQGVRLGPWASPSGEMEVGIQG